MRDELSDYEWTAIEPMLPNKPRGVRRVNDRRVLNGIFWVLRRTRDDKLAANYLAFVKLGSIRIWLRANESTP
jgi:transposase